MGDAARIALEHQTPDAWRDMVLGSTAPYQLINGIAGLARVGGDAALRHRLIETLERLKAERDLGILVVEHDMRLIMRLSDRMVVLNKGQKIAEGSPDAVRADPMVIEAYIGTKRHHKDQLGS